MAKKHEDPEWGYNSSERVYRDPVTQLSMYPHTKQEHFTKVEKLCSHCTCAECIDRSRFLFECRKPVPVHRICFPEALSSLCPCCYPPPVCSCMSPYSLLEHRLERHEHVSERRNALQTILDEISPEDITESSKEAPHSPLKFNDIRKSISNNYLKQNFSHSIQRNHRIDTNTSFMREYGLYNVREWYSPKATFPIQDQSRKTKRFQCMYCEKSFGKSSHLRDHLRTHSGERPFECTYCAKAFSQFSNLRTHLRIHTGEKPFKCHVCDKSFTQRVTLRSHLRTHTSETSSPTQE